MLRYCHIFLLFAVHTTVWGQSTYEELVAERRRVAKEIEHSIQHDLLDRWYPMSMDKEYGGFLSTFTYDFKPTGEQDKMIVTQARHTWTNAKAALRFPSKPHYKAGAKHGFEFLKNAMWDKEYGGFYQLVDRKGKVKGGNDKTAYGNAFAIFALAAYYEQSKDPAALQLLKDAFMWLEKHSHDPIHKGYFQHLQRDGTPINRTASTPSTSDIGYKDQNSSIHLLEAFTELYKVWRDPLVRERQQEMLFLITGKIVTRKGYMNLFFQPDWTPVSFADSSEAYILRHRYLDHVSFGHDVETAYLIMEAKDTITLETIKIQPIPKRMVDHALRFGWDDSLGGFYDQGYYFKDKTGITIIDASKNWWTQVEALNTLALLSRVYPKDRHDYFQKVKKLWEYCKKYMIDHQYGDWYEEGLDHDPQRKTALKGHIWKATYHQYRALTHCIESLID
jgi:cellobiose epimerase